LTNQRALVRNTIAICALNFCFTSFQAVCQSIAPLMMDDLAFSKTTIGLIQAVPGVFAVLFAPVLARLATGRWRRETLSGCFLLVTLACLLYSRASAPLDFVLPQICFGIASSTFWSNVLATSFQLIQGEYQTKLQGWLTAAQGVGAFGGPLLGGALAGLGFAWAFYVAAGIACLGVLASRLLSPSHAIEPYLGFWRTVGGAYARQARVMTRRPIVMICMAFVAMNCFLSYVMGGSFFVLYGSQIGLSTLMAAALISSRDACSALARLNFGAISRRLPLIALLGAGTALGALCLGLLPLAGSALGVGLVGVAQGLFLAFMPPAVNTLIGSTAAPEEQSFAIASMHASNLTAQTTMAPLLGFLLTRAGYARVYPVMGVLWMGLALLAWRAGARLLRENQAEPQAVVSQV
jgi:DHA1 family multidrug resistance protein-like MFS transporter